MAATVQDGSLQFSANIDDSELTKDLSDTEKKLHAIVTAATAGNAAMEKSSQSQAVAAENANQNLVVLQETLQNLVQANSHAFSPENLDEYTNAATEAATALSQVIQETADSFGVDKIKQLSEQLKETSDTGDQLKTILSFIKENLSSLNLNQTSTDTITAQINILRDAFQKVDAQAKVTATDVQQSFDQGASTIDINTASVAKLEAELDKLIQKETQLKAAIQRTLNPELLETYKNSLQQTESQMTQIAARLNELNADKFAQTVENANESGANLLTQLREMRYAIANAINEFGEGSPQVLKLIAEAAELEQRLKNADRQVALFASNTAGIDALKQAFNGMLGGITAIISATALFSDNNEELQKTMVKVFAVMQLVNGAEQLLAVTNKNSQVIQFARGLLAKKQIADDEAAAGAIEAKTAALEENTAATEANATGSEGLAEAEGVQTAATEGATGAMAALDAAMDANPIGIVILAITALAAGIAILVANTKNGTEEQTNLNNALAATNDLLIKQVELESQAFQDRSQDAQNAVNLAQAQGKSETDILKLKQQANDAARQQAIFQLAALGYSQKDIGMMQAKLDLLDEQIKTYLAIPSDDLTKEQKRQLDLLQSQQKVISGIYTAAKGYYDTIKQTTAQTKELTAAQQKLNLDNVLKSAAANADAQVQISKKGSDAQLQATIESIRAQQKETLNNANLTAGERVDINAKANLAIEQAYRDHLSAQLQIDKNYTQQVLDLEQGNSLAAYNAQLRLNADAYRQKLIDAKLTLKQIAQLEANPENTSGLSDLQKSASSEANAAKHRADLDAAKAYSKAVSEAEIQAEIAATNTKLTIAKQSSKDELDLKKQSVDEQAALQLLGLDKQKLGEQLYEAEVTSIHAKATADRKKLDDDYYQNQLRLQVEASRNIATSAIQHFEGIANDPLATAVQKDNAQINETLIQRGEIEKELRLTTTAYTDAVVRGSTEQNKYWQDIQKLNLALEALGIKLVDLNKHTKLDQVTETSDKIKDIAQGLSSLSGSIQSANPGLAEMASSLSNVVGQANNLYLVFSKTLSKEGAFQIAVSGTVELISMVINASAQRHQAEAEYQNDLIAYQDEYNKALNQSILLNYQLKDNVFITDFQAEITDGVKALDDATDKYSEALKNLSNAQVIAGKRSAVDWNKVLGGAATGAAAGAAIGSIVPVVGTAIGAAVGGIVGGVAGLFSKKSKDILKPILQEYPELIDQTKTGVDQFNDALAQSLIDANLVKGASKETLQSLVQWKQAVEAANKQIEDAVSTLAGQLGDNLRDSLVTAFEDGTDAGQAFAQSVGDSLQNVLKQLLFNAVFGDALKNLQDKLTSTLENGGNVTDVYSQFFKTYGGLSQQFTDQLKALQDQAKASGFDIFQNDQNGTNPNSLSGAIKGITEQTADLLEGQFNAIRLEELRQSAFMETGVTSLAKQTELMMQHLNYAIKIEANTGKTASNTDALSNMSKSLVSIDGRLADYINAERAAGIIH